MDARKAQVLKAVVEEYVRTGEAVPSRVVAERYGLGVSPATVRMEMNWLEREGYLTHRYTSSGRVPTDKGYRAYVQDLIPRGGPAPEILTGFFDEARRKDLEEILEDLAMVLSAATQLAALVLGPSLEAVRLRHLDLALVGEGRVVAVAVTEGGKVYTGSGEVPAWVGERDLEAFRAELNRELPGMRREEARSRLESLYAGISAGGPQAGIKEAVMAALDSPAPVYRGGLHGLLEGLRPPEAGWRASALLERREAAHAAVRDALTAKKWVRIGAENRFEELWPCAVVAAPWYLGRGCAGSVAVVGPVRMDYPWVMAAVRFAAKSLSRAVARG